MSHSADRQDEAAEERDGDDEPRRIEPATDSLAKYRDLGGEFDRHPKPDEADEYIAGGRGVDDERVQPAPPATSPRPHRSQSDPRQRNADTNGV